MNNKQIPQAPTPKKLKWKRRVIITGIVIAVIAILIFLLDNWALNKIENNSSQPKQTSQLEASLRYLNDIPEITWIDFDDNTVYIGFNPIPDDLKLIISAAALKGNKATNFGVHVWAIDASLYSKGWRPGSGTYIKEVTARYGKIE